MWSCVPDMRRGPDLTKVLQEHVKAEIAPYKYPRAIEFVDALPRTQTGKLQRFALAPHRWTGSPSGERRMSVLTAVSRRGSRLRG